MLAERIANAVTSGARWGPSVLRVLLFVLAQSRAQDSNRLQLCSTKSSFTTYRCPDSTVVACWSSEPYAPWACWEARLAGRWTLERDLADETCRTWPMPPGSGSPYYSGACTYVAEADSGAPTPAPAPMQRVPTSWDAAYERADETLARMEVHEKYSLLEGVGWSNYQLQKWWYVGNTPTVPRLGLPSMNIQDGGQGFRTYWSELVGTVTCWPSLLALSATWDASLVKTYAIALGNEFSGKGANGILGPSVNVHRVARNGRNFEYISGEDPYLGARLATAYVEGVQSQGVFAVVKHWIFNEQETKRNSESSNVDDKTAWELYFPPFEAAVKAGASAFMCSYNKVDGKHSCSSSKQLHDNLKEGMGFKGFVQSDWWATAGTSLADGLDQEMPGSGTSFFSQAKLEKQSSGDVDDAARRILAVMYRMDLPSSTKCSPPHCESWIARNVTGPAHTALAHAIAAESIVLLKNDQGVLPLTSSYIRKIAVIGSASNAPVFDPNGLNQGSGAWSHGDYYAGGGSGHVVGGFVVTPLEGIRKRAALAGIDVVASPGDSLRKAIAASKEADISVIVAGTTSGESRDRASLHLDNGADELIRAVAAEGGKTIVLVQAPGAVVMPWHKDVAGILMMFLGGQETGSAWADVLFGVHAPTGRLPLLIPDSEADAIQPSASTVVEYSEGLATSYRNPAFRSAFPFGHGLTYTTFQYSTPGGERCHHSDWELCVHTTVRNVGPVAARTVSQLYLEMPSEAGHPAPLLKGFQKTGLLLPGATEEVTFGLSTRDLSYYVPSSFFSGGYWTKVPSVTAHVGESSADLRGSVKLKVPISAPNWFHTIISAMLLLVPCGLCYLCWTKAWQNPTRRIPLNTLPAPGSLQEIRQFAHDDEN